MGSRLSRILALWLIVLGVLPCTAPFSLCDLGTLVGQHHPHDDGSSRDQNTHRALVKTAPAPHRAPALATTVAPAGPAAGFVAAELATPVLRASSRRPSLLALRI